MSDFRNIRLGVAPTRRDIYPSPEDAIENKKVIMGALNNIFEGIPGLEVFNIDDVIEDGLLVEERDVAKIEKYFKSKEIDALFVPHANFGQEESVAKLAYLLNVPVLVWGPRDGSPKEGEPFRQYDTHCGLFATTRALLRYGVRYTYVENCWLDSPVIENAIKDFINVASVVKAFKNMRILQLSNRPRQFLSVKVNEGELLERFKIEVTPVESSEILGVIDDILENRKDDIKELIRQWDSLVDFIPANEETKIKLAAVELGILGLAEKYGCNAVATECWSMFATKYKISPCFAYADLTEKGLPVCCENDINGAISSTIAKAVTRGETPPFFADITVRHPYNDNAELLWHCGPYPPSLAKEKTPKIKNAQCSFELKPGDITLLRFDGDRGEYVLFACEGKGVGGPVSTGNYVWFEIKNWRGWEKKLMTGPYIHHIVGIYGKYKDILLEATKYLAVKFDTVD